MTIGRVLRATAPAVLLALPFGVVAALVGARVPAVLTYDDATVRAATDLTRSSPALHRSLILWQEVTRPVWVNLAVATGCLWLGRRHGERTSARWAFATLMVAWGLQALTKQVVRRDRPHVEHAVAEASGFSFPSGHAANAAAAAVVVTVLVWPHLDRRARAAVPVVAATFVVLTALDRVLLGVHHPSDVVAGLLFGSAVAGASVAGHLRSTGAPAGWRERTRVPGEEAAHRATAG